jgi:hypothetical protein
MPTLSWAGDHSQLPPVRRLALYSEPTKGIGSNDWTGYALYRRVCAKNTVCLDRILRTNDEEYIKLQEDVRKGNWTKDHVDAINSRLHARLDDNDNDTTKNPEADYRPSVVIYNKTRFALHNAHMKHVSDSLHELGDQRPIVLDADIPTVPTRRVQTARATRTDWHFWRSQWLPFDQIQPLTTAASWCQLWHLLPPHDQVPCWWPPTIPHTGTTYGTLHRARDAKSTSDMGLRFTRTASRTLQSNGKLGTAMATSRMIPHAIGCTSGAALSSYCPVGDSIPHNVHATCLPAVTS